MDTCLEVPVLLLVAVLALVQLLDPVTKAFALILKSRLVLLGITQLFFAFGQKSLQAANLGDKGCTNFGGEFDVVNTVRGLVALLAS